MMRPTMIAKHHEGSTPEVSPRNAQGYQAREVNGRAMARSSRTPTRPTRLVWRSGTSNHSVNWPSPATRSRAGSKRWRRRLQYVGYHAGT